MTISLKLISARDAVALDPPHSEFVAAPIAGLFVARDTLNFTILQTMITILLIIGVLILVAVWPRSK
jgi:hypothetical protein